MKSDFYALIGYHNFCVYQDEINYVRELINGGGGELLEYVAKMARNDVGNVKRALKRATVRDYALAQQLRDRGYNRLVADQRDAEQERLDLDIPVDDQEISLEHTPEDFNILQREDYRIDNERVLLVIPCSQTKPYSNSRTHRVVADATNEWNEQIHKVTISGMYGPVPEQYENLSQVKSYEYVLTNAEKQRQQLVVDRLVSYLEKYGSQFDAIVGYATSKTSRTVIEHAFSEYGDGIVLPKEPKMRALTEHFRTTNLEELSEHLNDVLSSTPEQ